ncbi:MAG: DUF6270 domain-containing protein [Micropepsaceae bacterium]
MSSGDTQPADGATGIRPISFCQLGGCNVTQVIRFVPGGWVGPNTVRCSTASLVGEPVDPALYELPHCPKKARFVEGDFQKRPFADLSGFDWEVLLIDLLRDYLTGTAVFEGGQATEINEWVHGEPVTLDDVLKVPYRLIRWSDPEYFELWSASARTLYERLLKPRLDAGRHVAIIRLTPVTHEYRDNGEGYVTLPDGGRHESSEMLARMYDFAAALDPRIIMLDVEPEFAIGAFDVENGPFAYHMTPDYHARAADLLCARIGVPADIAAAHIAAVRLKETHRRYTAQLEREAKLKDEREAARRDLDILRARFANAEAGAAELRADLAVTRDRLAAAMPVHDGKDDIIAALTSRLGVEMQRAADAGRAAAQSEARHAAEMAARERTLEALGRDHEHVMENFREHIAQYDLLREEIDRRDAMQDETYEQVLGLSRQIRAFAERWAAQPEAMAQANMDATAAVAEMEAKLRTAIDAVEALSAASDGLQPDAPQRPGALNPATA